MLHKENTRKMMHFWLSFVVFIFIAVATLGFTRAHNEKAHAARLHEQRMNPALTEDGKTDSVIDQARLEREKPVKIKAGFYVERITEVSISGAYWIVDFYLWFRWKGNELDPGKNIQVVDGEIIKNSGPIVERSKLGEKYSLYKIQAKITKFFNTTLFPRDEHLLTIKIEDSKNQIYKQQYEEDKGESNISSRVMVQGYRISDKRITSKPHSYKTHRGDIERTKNDTLDTYSQLIYGIWIKRPGWGNYLKIFEGLFAAVAVSFLTFFISVTGTNRTSLGVGSFFAAVAATYVAERNLPQGGVLTLTDIINGFALLTIFLTIWHTIIVTRIHEIQGDPTTIRRYDRIGVLIFFFGYLLVNFALVFATFFNYDKEILQKISVLQ